MSYTINNYAGAPAITVHEAGITDPDTAVVRTRVPLGTIVRGHDPTYGEGEFIYLKGVASTIVGSIVEYTTSFATGLETTNVALSRPNAVAMSACVANEYGWYQISGISLMAKNTGTSLVADAGVRASAGFAVAIATGAVINGAAIVAVSAAASGTAPTTVAVMIDRPHGPSDVS